MLLRDYVNIGCGKIAVTKNVSICVKNSAKSGDFCKSYGVNYISVKLMTIQTFTFHYVILKLHLSNVKSSVVTRTSDEKKDPKWTTVSGT